MATQCARGFLAAGLIGGCLVAAQPPLCTVTMGLSRLTGVGEASGVAVSRRTPGIIWSHNDSGRPSLFAFDESGNPKGRVQVTGASVRDWEDIAAGPCREGSCLYVADIGDNNRARRQITIYRVPEPRAGDAATEPAETWTLAYPDGAHDAEALLVTPAGQLFLVSKEAARTTALYRVPAPAAGSVGRLQYVTRLPLERVTGATASPDGNWVALRTSNELLFYRTEELVAGRETQPRRFDLEPLGERQGEGVAFGPDGLVYLVGEGGGRSGTLATIRCSLR
ncbi:MAG: hypothetical protein ACRD3C_16195 [Vicinamibacterales bacterium]